MEVKKTVYQGLNVTHAWLVNKMFTLKRDSLIYKLPVHAGLVTVRAVLAAMDEYERIREIQRDQPPPW